MIVVTYFFRFSFCVLSDFLFIKVSVDFYSPRKWFLCQSIYLYVLGFYPLTKSTFAIPLYRNRNIIMSYQSHLISVYRGFVAACNEQRYQDVAQYLHNPCFHFGRFYTPESYSEKLAQTHQESGPIRVHIDYALPDDEQECVCSRVLVRCRPLREWLGFSPPKKDVVFSDTCFVWFIDGKISRIPLAMEWPAIMRQLQDPTAEYHFDSAEIPRNPGRTVSAKELENTLKDYVQCLNAWNQDKEILDCLQPQVIINGVELTNKQFKHRITELIKTIPDLQVTLKTSLLDMPLQRAAAQLELVGRPIGPVEGIAPTGARIRVTESVIWEFQEGKLLRLWSIMDYITLRQQLRPRT